MKNINHIKKYKQAAFITLLLFIANLTFAQFNLSKSPYYKSISSSFTGQSVAVIKADGTLWAWGHGANGQLGTGDTNTANPIPVQVGTGTDWAYVTQGSTFMLAIKTDGTLWGAGLHTTGVFGNDEGTTITSINPIAQITTAGTDWKYVTAGGNFVLGIKTNGDLYAWGAGANGKLGNGSTDNQNAPVKIGSDKWKAIAAGQDHALAIKEDGTLWGWGKHNTTSYQLTVDVAIPTEGYYTTPQQISSATDWVAIRASNDVSNLSTNIARKSNGEVYGWGNNNISQILANGSTNGGIVQTPTKMGADGTVYDEAFCYNNTSFLLKENGELTGVGFNEYGVLGINNQAYRATLVRAAGTAGEDTNALWDGIWGGYRSIVAVKTDGTLWAWGYNQRGQLGNNTSGTANNSTVPVLVTFPSVLPVTLVQFNADKENNRVKLSWTTASETNNSRFTVERSTDGSAFALLQNVSPKGSAGGSYVIYDNSPLSGINYYRLKQTDNNGKATELGVKSVNYTLSENTTVKTWPNPVLNHTLNVDFGTNAGKALTVTLTNIAGRTIHEQRLQQTQTKGIYTLTLSQKPQTGIYLLNVYGADVNYSSKIIVK